MTKGLNGGIMRHFKIFCTVLVVSAFMFSCAPQKKDMTNEDFVKIDIEMAGTDMTPEKQEKVAKKYGYTLEQYKKFVEMVEKDPKLKEELGEIMLKQQKSDK